MLPQRLSVGMVIGLVVVMQQLLMGMATGLVVVMQPAHTMCLLASHCGRPRNDVVAVHRPLQRRCCWCCDFPALD
jgi:hypothetical protein